MINKIGVDSTSRINSLQTRKEEQNGSPSFKGLDSVVLQGIQMCERMPMVNVTVVDMLSAILPRTIVESTTNWFAGFEAFRRESSGLVVNCLIPSLVTLGIAKCINPAFMPKGINMSKCWADSSLVDKAAEYYSKASSEDKVMESMKKILGNIEGYDGKNAVVFKDALGKDLDSYAKQLADLSRVKENKIPFSQRAGKWFRTTFGKEKKEVNPISEITKSIIEKTHVAENIKVVDGGKSVNASSVEALLKDSVKFFSEFQKPENNLNIENFAKQSKKLLKTKSLLGLGVILPLAISMQYINRWITGKISGVKGAPIYEDFGKNKHLVEQDPEAKDGLLKQKLISISSMIGVALLSMMKKPTMNMLEFKGMFPTMDQARIISTATFASRMAAADDKNELAEATVRDIATFSSLYFLGDYAAKAAATILQKRTGVVLLNETKKLDKNAGKLKKFWHWVKDTNIKSSEEVLGKTEKELKRAKNLRSACQVTNLGVSLALLGIIIPIFTRRHTKKKHEQAMKLAQENTQQNAEIQEQTPAKTPLNVEYSSLTQGFRANPKIA